MKKSDNRQPADLLVSCAEKSLNYLTNTVDPELNYEPYFTGKIYPVPYLEHSEWDFGDVTSRFIEAWYAVRDITGYRGGRVVAIEPKGELFPLYQNYQF